MSDSDKKSTKGTQVQSRKKPAEKKTVRTTDGLPCPRPCEMIPTNVPAPDKVQCVLHPRKDVFILKVAKVGPNGDRRCKMELELVTPKGPQKVGPYRVDTRETQCDPDPPCICCVKEKKTKKWS